MDTKPQGDPEDRRDDQRRQVPIYTSPEFSDAKTELESLYVGYKDYHVSPEDQFSSGKRFVAAGLTFLDLDDEARRKLLAKDAAVKIPQVTYSVQDGEMKIIVERSGREENRVPIQLFVQALDRIYKELYRQACKDLASVVAEIMKHLLDQDVLEWEHKMPSLEPAAKQEEADDAD